MAQWLMNPTRNHGVEGSIPGLAPGIRCCQELWCRLQMWLRSQVAVATALVRTLAWEPPCAARAAQEKEKKKKN